MGYFTSLQRQTGIAFEPGAEALERTPETLAAQTHPGPGAAPEEAAPEEIEEHRVIETPAPDRAQTAMRPRSGESHLPSEAGLAATKPDARKAVRQAAQAPRSSAPEAPTPVQPASNVDEGRVPEAGNEAPAADDSRAPAHATAERAQATATKTQPAGPDAQASRPPTGQRPARVRPAVQKKTRVVREQVWRTAYREILDWVTAQPVSTTREQREHIADKVVEQIQQKVPDVIQTESLLAGDEAYGPSFRAESQIDNIHVSIGKLEVSLDQSTLREHQPQSQGETRQSRPAAAPLSRRLRRHYITP